MPPPCARNDTRRPRSRFPCKEEAATGRVIAQKDLGAAIYVAPVVAQGKMYILTDDAKLIAFN